MTVLNFPDGVTLLGGGPVAPDDIDLALSLTGGLVCADGGANALGGRIPDAIIGDLDSLENSKAWSEKLGSRLIHVEEQESNDLEKCLSRIDAPFVIGIGCLGGRVDHELAALHTLLAERRVLILLGAEDIVFSAGTDVSIALDPGDRVSVFPLIPVLAGRSSGLNWPLEGLHLAAGSQIGTSNHVTGPEVRMTFDRSGAIVIVPRNRINAALAAVMAQTLV